MEDDAATIMFGDFVVVVFVVVNVVVVFEADTKLITANTSIMRNIFI